MSKKYATTHTYKINPSSWQNNYLICLHSIAIFSLVLSGLILLYKTAIIILILISLVFYLKPQREEYYIRYSDAFGWQISFSNNQYQAIQILTSTVITSYLIFFHFRVDKQTKQSTIICKDALIENEYRKLMIELKISGLEEDKP